MIIDESADVFYARLTGPVRKIWKIRCIRMRSRLYLKVILTWPVGSNNLLSQRKKRGAKKLGQTIRWYLQN